MTILAPYTYLQKHRYKERLIPESPDPSLALVIVIPVYKEPELLATLYSLSENHFDEWRKVEVILVVNHAIDAPETVQQQNQQTYKAVKEWIHTVADTLTIHPLLIQDLPKKQAGVGLARKIGMDEAVDRLEQVDNPQGLIICLDADTIVQPNYLQVLLDTYRTLPKKEAFTIHFEHPLEGKKFSSGIYEGIIFYELFLRYFIEGLRVAGYPYAFHTVGSAMAVRSHAYQKMGGMNRRQAGEDFYFLHKFTQRGKVHEIHDTAVIPSPRASDRVPFGTGKAIQAWLDTPGQAYMGYHPELFFSLKEFLASFPSSYGSLVWNVPLCFRDFLEEEKLTEKGKEAKSHVASQAAYVKRLYQWLSPLKVLQIIRAGQATYPDIELIEAVNRLFSYNQSTPEVSPPTSAKEWLGWLRKRQKRESYP